VFIEPLQASVDRIENHYELVFLEISRLNLLFGEFLCVTRIIYLVPAGTGFGSSLQESYLVDPASSHMLVSKIKPCMSKYKQLYTVKLRTAHYISYNLFDGLFYMDNRSNSRANTCVKSRLVRGGMYLLVKKPMRGSAPVSW
jgi:hypothetical protein